MKHIFKSTTLFILFAALCFSGCQKGDDKCRQKYSFYRPVYKTLSAIRKNIKSTAPTPLQETGKIYIKGNYILVNEPNKGIHVIDNTNPRSPKNVSFISIPGNIDMAVKGDILYADSYNDLVTINIRNPKAAAIVKFTNNIFPEVNGYYLETFAPFNPDSIQVTTEWIKVDTMISCQDFERMTFNFSANDAAFRSSLANSSSSTSKGGSMARFTLVNDYFYTVTNSMLKVFNVSDAADPVFKKNIRLGWGIETIYPFKNKLFIGSTTGMFIFDITQPETPVQLSRFTHAQRCDPVVADDKYAYVTLRSGTTCNGNTNELNVVDVTRLESPVLKKTYNLTHPHGLSKDGELLFVCDGRDGFKIYETPDGYTLNLLQHITGLETFDVITWNNRALVVAKNGLYQYDYSDRKNIKRLSSIEVR